ncbi:homoserine O-succinyltransferase MetX [Amphiplicatus metriothermophilus]|uniref:Homoserine O-acetyltransferase n=1 Tax=Amphiplicatus metriothermophilus TaxID=1519374 RepID=A0A239PPC2_9PROT|nr:homoserine O-succinyltransferase [Amphiplicatus metriothermophilus]MBB5518869.1 homoserine O-acetyltransferase [Amphiplicatus metriothermophilus]SNT71978.1 homoserine O-acetyltransferase [Amphiplicatus metriothermophilus]
MTALAILKTEAGDCTRPAPLSGWRVSALPWRDVDIELGADFRLESGERLDDPVLRIRLHGPEAAPAIVAAGGISAGKRVADAGHDSGWWRDVARPGGAIDLDRFQLLGFDFLPGAESDARAITPADQARALALALDRLGIARLHALVGASYGGFIGLAFASLFPERLERLAVISAAARSDPMTTALRGVQRRIIAFGLECGRPEEGVALARQLAMTTYRSAEELRRRFDCAPRGARPGDPYDVCEYLIARGRAYAQAMPAARYLTLSDSLDRACVDPADVKARCLFVAVSSDRLVPARDTQETARAVSGPSDYLCIDSLVGHDAFLCEPEKFSDRLSAFLGE